MKAWWSLFWQLLALRRGPEDMPRSIVLLFGVVVVNTVLSIVSTCWDMPAPWLEGSALVGIALAIDVLALWALLRFKDAAGLYVQSLMAIYLADTLLSIAAIPLILLASNHHLSQAVLSALKIAEIVLLCWSLGVRGFIYHRSLRVGIFQGNMLAVALFLLTQLVSVKIFPQLLS